MLTTDYAYFKNIVSKNISHELHVKSVGFDLKYAFNHPSSWYNRCNLSFENCYVFVDGNVYVFSLRIHLINSLP